MVAFGLMWGR